MPLAWFSDLMKVTVSLCSKTLWDERNPNWIETLVCNCLIPFCSIQEKERAQSARETHLWFSDEIDWHGVEYSRWCRWMQWLGSSSIVLGFFYLLFFCIATDGMRVREAFVVFMLVAGLFFMIPMSPVCSTHNQWLSVQTKHPSQVITFIEPKTLYENMYSGIQEW